MQVLVITELQRRSTEAARDYVQATRDRLGAELAREGPDARRRRSFQELEATITAVQLARVWPHADLEVALAEP